MFKRIAIGGAWIFAVGTWLVLAAGLAEGVVHGAKHFTGDVFYVGTPDGRVYESWGLAYRGLAGFALLAAQAAAVGVAIVWSRSRRTSRRRVGLIALCAWCALWTANAAWIWNATGALQLASAAGVVFLICTLVRAGYAWNRTLRGGFTIESGGDTAKPSPSLVTR